MTKLNDLTRATDTESFICCEASPAGYPNLVQFVVICLDNDGKAVWSRWFFSKEHALTALDRAVKLAKSLDDEFEVEV